MKGQSKIFDMDDSDPQVYTKLFYFDKLRWYVDNWLHTWLFKQNLKCSFSFEWIYA